MKRETAPTSESAQFILAWRSKDSVESAFFAMLTHWAPLTVSLVSYLLDIFSTVVWLGLATCWRRISERNLSVGSLHAPVLCFTQFHQVLGWSSCLALSNQQACVRPYCFTGRPRPLGTSFSTGSMVLSFCSAPSSMRFLPYGFLATGSPRLTAFLAPLSPAKLPVSYPFFLSSPCTNFDPTDFCHLRRRSNLLICLMQFLA